MKFVPGDKVSFINEKQDGIVKAIRTDGSITVEIEEGFTLDVLPSELVKIRNVFPSSAVIQEKKEVYKPEDAIPDLVKYYTNGPEIIIAAVPENGQVLTGKIRYWLINSTDNIILYTFSILRNKLVKGIAHGILNPDSIVEISEWKRDELINLEFLTNILFYSSTSQPEKLRIRNQAEPVVPGLIQPFPKLTAPWSFAQLHTIYSENSLPEPDLNLLSEKYKTETGHAKLSQKHKQPARSGNSNSSAFDLNFSLPEVDLHIEEITTDSTGLTSSEMLQVQLAQFRKELDRALLTRQSAIVFIHGIGNGKLRAAIWEELTALRLPHRDASYEKYGAGATEVTLA